VGAIVLAQQLPESVDAIIEPLVGASLIVLGVYVFASLARHGRGFRMRSRWMLVFAGVRRGRTWLLSRRSNEAIVIDHEHEHPVDQVHADAHKVQAYAGADHQRRNSQATVTSTHRHAHRHVAVVPDDPFTSYGRGTAFAVGMLHGIGAETPTQVLIFLAAAQAGGRAAGVVLLLCFVAGLLTSNSLVALAATLTFRNAAHNFKAYAAISVVTAAFSMIVGALLLFGRGGLLPTIFGG
jgi:high-affinity nickel-transport protein